MKEATVSITPMGVSEHEQELFLSVPEFPPGPDPPADHTCVPLLDGYDGFAHFAVYLDESLLRESLIAEEQRFRLEHPNDWHERCWFILGEMVRSPTGELWGRLTGFAPAENMQTSNSCFIFSPATWRSFEATRTSSGKICLGWVHTHSLEKLSEATAPRYSSGDDGITPKQQATAALGASTAETQPASGLFLSRRDIFSARRLGFNAPYHLTCVLDSDACLEHPADTSLADTFAVWGFVQTQLCRRSVFMY